MEKTVAMRPNLLDCTLEEEPDICDVISIFQVKNGDVCERRKTPTLLVHSIGPIMIQTSHTIYCDY